MSFDKFINPFYVNVDGSQQIYLLTFSAIIAPSNLPPQPPEGSYTIEFSVQNLSYKALATFGWKFKTQLPFINFSSSDNVSLEQS